MTPFQEMFYYSYFVMLAMVAIMAAIDDISYPNFQLSTPLVLLEKLMPSLITVRLSIAKGAA